MISNRLPNPSPQHPSPRQSVRILLVDDDPDLSAVLDQELAAWSFDIDQALDSSRARELARGVRPDVVLLDLRLGDENGLELIADLRQLLPLAPIVLISGHKTSEVADLALRLGAFDFLEKPLDGARLVLTLQRALDYGGLRRQVDQLQSASVFDSTYEGMLGRSPLMKGVFEEIDQVAATEASVLLVGESGTGKEKAARAIHNLSSRSGAPFVALNMSAVPGELVESTLFGHERGAFTGADRLRIGVCEEASGGTLFLDEISAMPVVIQPKLLRFLQEKRFRRVGGAVDMNSDVRIVSATNLDPQEQVRTGKLRMDLYFRLNVVPIFLPPLRERTGDIELLATQALREYARRHGRQFEDLSPAVLAELESHAWPGNVRQLLHLIERVVILQDARRVELDMLPRDFLASTRAATRPSPMAQSHHLAFGSAEEDILPLAVVERQAIENALLHCDQSPSRAAKRLGISEATIYRKIKSYGLPSTASRRGE